MSIKVKLSGSHLTPQCYSFITYVQVSLFSFCLLSLLIVLDIRSIFIWCNVFSLQSGELNGGVNEKKKKRKEEDAVVAASVRIFTFLKFLYSSWTCSALM